MGEQFLREETSLDRLCIIQSHMDQIGSRHIPAVHTLRGLPLPLADSELGKRMGAEKM